MKCALISTLYSYRLNMNAYRRDASSIVDAIAVVTGYYRVGTCVQGGCLVCVSVQQVPL